jgi:hypothetical protein
MKKPAKIIIFLSILSFFISASAPAKAQSSLALTVSPTRQNINIDPGGSESTYVTFFNQSDLPIAGNIKIVDFIVKDASGTPYLLEEGTFPSKYSAASWITTNADKAVIAAGTSFKVQMKIKAPENAAPGGRYAAVFFEPTGTLPNTKAFITQKEGQQSVSSRLVALINIRVNGPITEQAGLKQFVTPNFLEYGPVNVKAEVLNNGSYHIVPKGNITLSNWQGKVVDQYNLEEKNIFPERSRIYEASLGPKFMIGKYKVAFMAIYGDANQVISAEKVLWVFPWKLALATALALIIVILLAILIVKRTKARQKELEEKLEKEISEIEKLKEKFKDTPITDKR